MKHLVLLLSFLLIGSSHAGTSTANWSKELQSAQDALAAKQFDLAYRLYQKQASHNGLAQFVLGMFHQNGWGRKPNPVIACTYFEKSAQRHVPTGEHNWGDCLAQGIGRPVDIPAALVWYDQATRHGHAISACSAADYYIQGKGVEQDVQRGIQLCTQAAGANAPSAMLKLARYYEQGGPIPQDLGLARHWYQEAAQRHSKEGQHRLGVMLAQGEGGEPDLNGALFWLETAASEGYAPAYLPTAILYANAPAQAETGALAPQHLAKAYLWTSAAKQRGSTPDERAAAEKIETQILAVMPATWRPDLDKQVVAHIAKYSN